MCIRDRSRFGEARGQRRGDDRFAGAAVPAADAQAVSYTHLRAHETPEHLVCRLLLEKKKKIIILLILFFFEFFYLKKKKKFFFFFFFFLMIRRPPRSTLDRSSAASDVYKRQGPCPPLMRRAAAAWAHSPARWPAPVSYTHLRAHETPEHLVCRLLLEKKKL